MYWIALTALALAAAVDLRRREIPDVIPLVLLAVALVMKLLGLHPVPWSGLALGVGVALAVSVPMFALGGLGGGDVKLLAALGAVLGVRAFLPFVLVTAILGGLLALVLRRKRGSELPYAPVMFAGLLSMLPLVWYAR